MIGYKGIQLLSREVENEFEFSTIMWFDKIESVKQFMGEEYETAMFCHQHKSYCSAMTKNWFAANCCTKYSMAIEFENKSWDE